MGKGLSYLKISGIWVNYCWNYGPSKLLLQFIEYRVDQLNNKQTKIAVNSAIQYFEGCSQNKCLLKVQSFLVHPQQNGGPVVFPKLNGNHLLMGSIFKLHYQNQNFSLVSTSAVSVALVSHSCRSCSTLVARVWHLCCKLD